MVKKQKKVSEMKTSELLDELGEDPKDNVDDKRVCAVDKELEERYPLCYYKEMREEFEESIKKLQSQISELKQHHHKHGKVLTEV